MTPNGAVFGGGVYDGRFNVDLMHDVNMVVRPLRAERISTLRRAAC